MVVDAEDKIASELAADAPGVLVLAGHLQGITALAWEQLLQAAQEVLLPPAAPSLQCWRVLSGSVYRLETLRLGTLEK